jgi:ABC-type antimicrobial peptide transport system permease subunit
MEEMGMEPLMYFSFSPFIFYNQALVVFFLTLVIGIYPIYRAFKLKVNQALRA